jgi:ABC-type transporter Mla subunit MlaD
VAVSIALAVWTGIEIASLRSLTDTLATSSQALATTADGLASLEDVPVVGDRIGDVAAQVNETAASARRSASEARRTIGVLAALVSIAIFAISTVPPLAAYLTVRRAWRSRSGWERRRGRP